jgi:outer membrane lipoprotein-sorting protein
MIKSYKWIISLTPCLGLLSCSESVTISQNEINSMICTQEVTVQTSSGFQQGTSQIWETRDKSRTQLSSGEIVIRDGEVQYSFSKGKTVGHKSSVNVSDRRWFGAIAEFQARIREFKQKAKHMGKETIDGVACDRFEYEQKIETSGEKIRCTCWVSGINQLPIRIVDKTDATTSTINYKGLQINVDIPGHLFEPPSDVRFIETVGNP